MTPEQKQHSTRRHLRGRGCGPGVEMKLICHVCEEPIVDGQRNFEFGPIGKLRAFHLDRQDCPHGLSPEETAKGKRHAALERER